MTKTKYGTSYYNIGFHEPKDLTIKVLLWQVQPPKVSSGVDLIGGIINTNINTKKLESIVKWQEKIDSPREKIMRSQKKQLESDREMFTSSCDPFWRIAELNDENTIDDSASVAAYDRDKPIFTYANGDYFISNSSSSVDHCTSSRDTTATNVENAMRHLPSHNLHSKATLDSSAAILHDRLSRDGSYKFMHIMAAVDCDEDKMLGSTDSDEVKDSYHEELICSLKWSQKDGVLEVSPGFSTHDRDYFDSDSEIFVSPENMDAMRRNEHRLTTFSFISPNGAMYQYTLELQGYMSSWDELEELELCRVDDEYEAISEKRKIIMSKAKEHYSNADKLPKVEHLMQIEIVSASKFNPICADQRSFYDIPIFIAYQILSPCGAWTTDSALVHAQMDSGQAGEEVSPIAAKGQTQASKPTEYSNGGSSSDIFSLWVTVILFMISSLNQGIYRGAVFTVLMLVLYDAVNETSSQVQEMNELVYHFGHPISMYRTQEYSKDQCKDEPSPQGDTTIVVQVYAKQSESTVCLLGCGSLKMSTRESNYEIELQTCRPVSYEGKSELWLRLQDYYLGSTLNEIQSENILIPNMKKGVVTEESGTVRLRVQNISSNFSSSLPELSSEESPLILRESIDEVLSRLRRNKRERTVSDALDYAVDKTNFDNLRISKKTREVLERAKARKDARFLG